jgi:hypothetical protein
MDLLLRIFAPIKSALGKESADGACPRLPCVWYTKSFLLGELSLLGTLVHWCQSLVSMMMGLVPPWAATMFPDLGNRLNVMIPPS